MPITDMTARELSQALAARELSAREAASAYLERIREQDPQLNTYITVTEDRALAAADASDARRSRGEALSPLDGVPMALEELKRIMSGCQATLFSLTKMGA